MNLPMSHIEVLPIVASYKEKQKFLKMQIIS